ncbi:MAG: FAD:protein FMN transferase [Eudoraea sp.]|nr:FAD:protein FMN transferase [Eudoraea sp.]
MLCLLLFPPMAQAQQEVKVTVRRTIPIMGSPFEITVVAQNEEIGYINIEEAAAEVVRIEKLISSWDPESETSIINKNAGIQPVKVSTELFKLIERALQISEITYGAFDISYAALDQLWRFDGSMEYLPTSTEIKKAVAKVGYRKIVLNPSQSTVYLKEKGMKIGFGAIGKGYAADKAKELLVSKQVPAGMINASGDITTWGTKATGEKWLIGVDNPTGKGAFFSWLPLIESSVAISGNHRDYVTLNGKRYSHIINPKTGYPVMGLRKVTVLAKSAELCDALSTAVFILGKKLGMALINQLDGTEAVILDEDDKVFRSNGILLGN